MIMDKNKSRLEQARGVEPIVLHGLRGGLVAPLLAPGLRGDEDVVPLRKLDDNYNSHKINNKHECSCINNKIVAKQIAR